MEKGTVYFFTGLAGAGKSTIGRLFYQRLKEREPNTILVDGDMNRDKNRNHDYSTEGRRKASFTEFKRINQLAEQGQNVVICCISMYRDVREWNRTHIERYREIYIKVNWETLLKRNQKGLYSPGQKNVVGVDLPYDEPEMADVVIQNDGQECPEEIVNRIEQILCGGTTEMYDTVKRTSQLCRMLQDDLSRRIFWARVKFDVEPNIKNGIEMARVWQNDEFDPNEDSEKWKEKIQTLLRDGNNVILYGTSITGQRVAQILQYEGIDFTGFCGRRAAAFTDGLMGKPVVSPDWLFAHAENSYVVITASVSFGEISKVLIDHDFPKDHILPMFINDEGNMDTTSVQYFEFPELYRRNTAFIDGGCYDGESSIYFAKWCQNQYSSIYAFEPDPQNYDKCRQKMAQVGLHGVTLLKKGMSDENKTVRFSAKGSMNSHVISENAAYFLENKEWTEIEVSTIDSVIQQDGAVVGMIKMDIEGAEMEALQGAKQTIMKDKPLLAICVYHKPGDVLAIMDYCAKLVPEYKFWLRQYYWMSETVLYASIR